jgi:hypothetical protein
VPFKQAVDVNEVWCNLVDEVTKPVNDADKPFNQDDPDKVASERFNKDDIKAFAAVLNENYATEERFEEDLFIALKTCLSHRNLIRNEVSVNILEKEDGNNAENLEPIVFHYGLPLLPEEDAEGLMYAIGIARRGTCRRRASDDESADQSSILRGTNCKRHHGSFLLKRETRSGQWTAVKCFSEIELKVGKENDGFVVSVEDDEVKSFDITSGKGAILQALMCNLEWIMPSHAEVGELQDLPWAAIVGRLDEKADFEADSESEGEEEDDDAGNETFEHKSDCGKTAEEAQKKKDGDTPTNNRYRWVAGEMFVPEKCGGRFGYAVTKCGNLEAKENCASVENVISIYLETLLFGIRAAKKMLDAINEVKSMDEIKSKGDIKSQDEIKLYPASGKKLKFGEVFLPKMELRGKPPMGTVSLIGVGMTFTGQHRKEKFSPARSTFIN